MGLGIAVGRAELAPKGFVIGKRFELAELAEIGDPVLAEGLRDGVG